ncbi:MAG: DMT family transporter [Crocinitomicaceae bacterium]
MSKGVLYMILSGLCFIIVNFFVKLLGAQNSIEFAEGLQKYPAHELVLARSVVSLAISFVVIKQKKLPLFGNNKTWLIIRGVAGTIALTIFFYTLHHLPLALAAVIQYLAPIFTVFFAILLLGEKVKVLQWLFIGISFSGVGLITISKLYGIDLGENISLEWLILGIIAAVFSGVAYVSIMKLRTTDAPISIVFYFPLIAAPTMTIFCLFDFVMPQGIEWVILLVIGIFTQFAQILMTKAFHLGKASVIAPVQYLGAIYAYLIGFFMFDESLSWIIDLGIILIIFGVFANAILRNR